VLGLHFSLVAFSLLIGRGIATFAGDAVGVVPLLVGTSVVMMISGLVAVKLLREPSAGEAPAHSPSQPQLEPGA
jgi:hypothetical protein